MNSNSKIKFTDEQQAVININSGINLVLAPAGSGKTQLLSKRVIEALNNGHDNTKMACLTFTVKAGKEMLDRVNEECPDSKVTIGNVHSVCYSLLKKEGEIDFDAQVLEDSDQKDIMRNIMLQSGMQISKNYKSEPYINSYKVEDLLNLSTYIDRKSKKFPQTHLIDIIGSNLGSLIYNKLVLSVIQKYIEQKKENKYLDFDDILTYAYLWVKNSNGKSKTYDWLQIDEVQDLNQIQFDIIDGLCTDDATVVYFGDYNQAIYGFMGASRESKTMLEKKSEGNVFYLTQNFRSPRYLMDLYNKYLSENNMSDKKEAFSKNLCEKPEFALTMFKCTKYNQYDLIAREIIPWLIKKVTAQNEKIALLVNRNLTAQILSDRLKGVNIDHFRISGYDMFERTTAKSLMSFLQIVNDSAGRASIVRLLYSQHIIDTLKNSENFVKEAYDNSTDLIELLENNNTTKLEAFFAKASTRDIVVFDTETTGLDTLNDDVIQIAAVRIREGKKAGEVDIYINTDKDISATQKVHKITREKLDSDGVSHKDGIQQFIDFCGENSILVAHNLNYDFNILTQNYKRHVSEGLAFADVLGGKENFFDSLTFVRQIYPKSKNKDLKNYKLETLLDYLKLEGENNHNALFDTRATANLVIRLLKDGKQTTAVQKSFILENDKKIQRIYQKLNPLFEQTLPLLNTNMSLEDFSKKYIDILYNSNNDKSDKETIEKDKKEMEKLFTYFKKKIDTTENQNIPLKYKIDKFLSSNYNFTEVDLLVGDEKVIISTVHKAKGLEFDNVIITDGSAYNSYGDNDRKLYVAMTRAQKRLIVTMPYESNNCLINKVKDCFTLQDCTKADEFKYKI